VSDTVIDPAFPHLVAWARAANVDMHIVSDNFGLLIDAILDRHGLSGLPVLANELVCTDGRLEARFPFRDPRCPRCAHCKAQHLRVNVARPRIFVGDGLSDVCPAGVADVVFAKDSLAADLDRHGVPFRPYRMLHEILSYVQQHHAAPLARA
jgi:HAD superfamily phosphoserine phosphatase-like hydrolase